MLQVARVDGRAIVVRSFNRLLQPDDQFHIAAVLFGAELEQKVIVAGQLGENFFYAPHRCIVELAMKPCAWLALAAAAYFPPPDSAGGWRTRTDPKFDAAFETARGTTKHGGLLVAHHGWLVYERYFGRGEREAAPNTASCGKSVTSAAAGILIAERPDLFPDGLDQRIFTHSYFPPEAFPLADPRMREIRLGQLLAMTAGIRGNNPGYVRGREVTLDPPGPDGAAAMVDRTALDAGMWCDPGEGWSYSTASAHLVSMMIRHIAAMELQEYVARRIAAPLGWGRWGYGYRSPAITHTPGGGGIALRSTDMLRFGYLLLHEGRWGSRQVIPEAYVRHCRSRSRYNPHSPYSLQFDINDDGHLAGVPRDAFWKQGSGGHCLFVVPSLDLVIWKLGGRDEQYDESRTNVPPASKPLARYDGSREGWKPEPGRDGPASTLQSVVKAILH